VVLLSCAKATIPSTKVMPSARLRIFFIEISP
jgi:hypothetical protein